LDATIVTSPKQRPVLVKEGRSDRNPTFGHTEPGFLESNIEHRLVIKSLFHALPRREQPNDFRFSHAGVFGRRDLPSV
jgi:hypothetical protein